MTTASSHQQYGEGDFASNKGGPRKRSFCVLLFCREDRAQNDNGNEYGAKNQAAFLPGEISTKQGGKKRGLDHAGDKQCERDQ
ncbi:MAG: hypothetical protein M1539_02245 [Actinobacteria bacterium]|nr:hypothetical protein [Actinomycetota bacterium]MCL5882789.1 hypothetical protein [Actinomycetota bacterium]